MGSWDAERHAEPYATSSVLHNQRKAFEQRRAKWQISIEWLLAHRLSDQV